MADKVLIITGFGAAPEGRAFRGYIKEIISDNLSLRSLGPIRKALIGLVAFFAARAAEKKRATISKRPERFKQLKNMAALVGLELGSKGEDVSIRYAFRYGRPSIEDVLKEIGETRRVDILPLFAHETFSTTGTIEKKMREISSNNDVRLVKLRHDHPCLIEAWAASIDKALKKNELEKDRDLHLLFSAHAAPLKDLRAESNRYVEQILETAGLISSRVGAVSMSVAYQSRTPFIRSNGPSIIDELCRLGRMKTKHCMIVPISFIYDNIETWYDLDKEILPKAGEFGIERLLRAECPALSPHMVKAIAETIL